MTNNKPERDVFYWLLYIGAALVAGFHTFSVFQMTDPLWVSLLAAIVVDGVVAYSAQKLGEWTGSQRTAGLFGIGLFGFISGVSQVIMRFQGDGVGIPIFLHWVSLALVPLASTGTVLVLAAIKYYGNSRPALAEMHEIRRATPENSVQYAPPLPAIEDTSRAVDTQLAGMIEKAPEGESDSIFAPFLGVVKKRGRGRPKKVVYAKDVEPGPKL